MNDEQNPAEQGAEATRPATTPDVPQATNSVARIVIIVIGLIIAAILALGAIILPNLPQPQEDQSTVQTP